MITEIIRSLYQYNHWANARILATAAHLSPQQLTEPRGASFDSIHNTLVHIMSAQWIWLLRWKGTSPRAMLDPRAFLDLAAISANWDDIERDTHEFIVTVGENDLVRIVRYVNTQGEEWAYLLWQQMIHQVNHATQHRSEVAMILTEFGYSPGWLDLLYFYDQQGTHK